MIDEETINRMYPDDASKEVTEPDTTPDAAEQDEVLENLYPKENEPTENPYILDSDKDEVETRLYASTQKVELASDDDLTLLGEDDEQRDHLRENLGFMAHTAGATQQDVSSFIEVANQHILSGETYDENTVMKDLYQEHGPSLHQKLSDARALVQTYPELSKWLNESGAGNSPKLIDRFIKLAQTERSQLRIKKGK